MELGKLNTKLFVQTERSIENWTMSVAVAVGNSMVSFEVRWVVILKASEGQRNNGQEKASESQIIRGIKSSLVQTELTD